MGQWSSFRAWRRGWALLLTATPPGQRLPWQTRWGLRVRALGDLPGLVSFRVGVLILLASMVGARSLVWRHDIGGALRDAVLVLPVIFYAPWAARLYRWCLAMRSRARQQKLAANPRRCSNTGYEDLAETDPGLAGRHGGPRAGRDHRGASVRGSERLSRRDCRGG